MVKFNFTPRIKLGIALIYLAGLGYLAGVIIPFTHIGHKVAIWFTVLVVAEILFVAGIATLGKPLYKQFKQRLINALQSQNRR